MVLFLRSIKSFCYIPENESEQTVLGWNTSLVEEAVDKVREYFRSIFREDIKVIVIGYSGEVFVGEVREVVREEGVRFREEVVPR